MSKLEHTSQTGCRIRSAHGLYFVLSMSGRIAVVTPAWHDAKEQADRRYEDPAGDDEPDFNAPSFREQYEGAWALKQSVA